MKIVNNLIFTLASIQKVFLKNAGHVLHWAESHVEAFSSLLSFYEATFKNFKSLLDKSLLEKLLAQTMEEEWMRILKEFSEGMLFEGQFKWIQQSERHRIIMKTWKFFTSLMQSLAQHNFQTRQSQTAKKYRVENVCRWIFGRV